MKAIKKLDIKVIFSKKKSVEDLSSFYWIKLKLIHIHIRLEEMFRDILFYWMGRIQRHLTKGALLSR